MSQTLTPLVAQETGTTGPVALKVNGQEHTLILDHRTSLLDALREHMDLSGTKKVAITDNVGAYTVLIASARIYTDYTSPYDARVGSAAGDISTAT